MGYIKLRHHYHYHYHKAERRLVRVLGVWCAWLASKVWQAVCSWIKIVYHLKESVSTSQTIYISLTFQSKLIDRQSKGPSQHTNERNAHFIVLPAVHCHFHCKSSALVLVDSWRRGSKFTMLVIYLASVLGMSVQCFSMKTATKKQLMVCYKSSHFLPSCTCSIAAIIPGMYRNAWNWLRVRVVCYYRYDSVLWYGCLLPHLV